MAANQLATVEDVGKLNMEAQRRVVSFANACLEKSKQFSLIRDKFDEIDVAYARYKASQGASVADGIDNSRDANTACNVFAEDDVTPPIVVSQVDSYVAYLAEVFLSGSPIFPVVSPPSARKDAEALESIITDHSILGGYARQLLIFIRDAVKYNFSALEVDWCAMDQFSVAQDITAVNGQKVQRGIKKYNRIKRLNPRNVIWDWSLTPGDVAENGDYAGYIEKVSRTKLKRLFNKWTKDGSLYGKNIVRAFSLGSQNATGWTPNYVDDPTISNYKQSSNLSAAPSWDAWFDPQKSGRRGPPTVDATYEIFYLYARIMPADFGIAAPNPNTPQIWKFGIVNGQTLVTSQRIISAYDYLPILFGQPLEDGLGYQTQSIAEGEIPFQRAANTLFNIRFAAARRAVSDRALYLPDMIKPEDINSPVAAPKIPVNLSVLSTKTIADAYHPIPFDMRGTETTIQDASLIVQFSKELHGVNSPRQGQFQKGNKSVQEWTDTMGGSDGRMRLPALTLEHQVFSPLKSILALNILQFGEDGTVTSYKSKNQIEYKIAELRQANLTFEIADGYTPKSKIASTDVILAGMQMIGNSPILQQQFGPMLPSMFLHFMSLSGVKGLDEYDPRLAQQQIPGMQNIPVNNLQNPGQPTGPSVPPVVPPQPMPQQAAPAQPGQPQMMDQMMPMMGNSEPMM